MLTQGTGPDVPRLIGDNGGATGWGDVVAASVEKEKGAAPEAVKPTAEEEPTTSTSEEVRPLDVAVNDVLSVLLASTTPLDLDAIAIDVNADSAKHHVPKGVIEALLDGDLASKVTRTDEGDPPRFHYALTATARAEIEQPGRVREARAAVVVLLAGRTSYTNTEGAPTVQDRLTAFDLAQGMVVANGTGTSGHAGPSIPVAMVTSFYHGLDPAQPDQWVRAIEGHLTALSAAGLVEIEGGPVAADADADAPDATYALTADALALFQESGAQAVVERTFPPKPAALTSEQVEASVQRRIAEAVAASEVEAALFKRYWEASVADLTGERRITALYERWFTDQHVADPRAMLEARASRGRAAVRESFEYRDERELTHDELRRVIKEASALSDHIKQYTEEAGARKAADGAYLKTQTAKLESLREIEHGWAEGRKSHVVLKKAHTDVVLGKLVTISDDPHDAGTVLHEEELHPGAQLELAGAKLGGPQWTPTASAPSAPVTNVTVVLSSPPAAESAVPVNAAPVSTEPPALPAPCGKVELKLPALIPVLKAMVAHPAHAKGLLGLSGVATALCTWTGMTRTQAMDKALAKSLKAMLTEGDLCQGEGGPDTLYWAPSFADPRIGTASEGTPVAPVKAKRTKKVAPAPSADPRPEDVKEASAKAKGAKGAKGSRGKAGGRA